MRHGRIALTLAISLGLLAASAILLRKSSQGEQGPERAAGPVAMPTRGITFELTLGLKDDRPTDWDGELTLSSGTLTALDAVSGGARIDGPRWTAHTEQAATKKAPAKAKAKMKKTEAARVAPVRLAATLDAAPTATAEVRTPHGRFRFVLGDVTSGRPSPFLDGAASVERVPMTRRLTETAEDDDFPASAVAPDGSAWCAFVAYRHAGPVRANDVAAGRFESLVARGHGDQVKLLHFADDAWSPPIDLTDAGLDVWRPAIAVDGRGVVWVVWSQNLDGNWDLHARGFDPKSGKLGDVRRLTTDPGPDLNAVAAGGGAEGVWVAWQAWRRDNFDIHLARLDGDAPIREERVSTSAANDWSPAIVADPKAGVWVGWDTYDRGNYDVFVRNLAQGRLDDPVPIATSPRFEARPSLALDEARRLWVAYEDAGANWGKDYGSRFPGKQGVPFYLERAIAVRCLDRGQLRRPKAEFQAGLIDTHYDDQRHPMERRQRVSIPRLARDGQGTVWLLYRRHPSTTGEGERWVSFATHYGGDRWSAPVSLRRSDNLLDNRPALTPLSGGGLLAVYSSDHRTGGSPSAKVNDLYAARIDADARPTAPELVAADAKGDGVAVEPIHPDESAQVRRVRDYRIEAGGKTYHLLRGDFHRHSEMSAHRDWDGPMEEIWRYGLDVAAMDWIGPTDHEYAVAIEYLWYLTQKQIDLYHVPSRFLTMFTYERSLPYPSGHRNVMFARRGVRPLPPLEGPPLRFGTPEAGAPDIKNLYAYLKAFDGLCSSHTSATSMGTDWRDNDPTVEPVVEIIQGHRQNYEEPKAPQAARDAEDSIQGYHLDGFVWNALAKGYKLGFQSSSDHVSTHISYAIVLAEEPTRAGLVAALKKRHSYAAQDNIVVDVRCGDAVMGDETTVESPPRLDINVLGTAPVTRLEIVRQVGHSSPVYVYQTEPNRPEVKFAWTDEGAAPGQTYLYYVRIGQADGKLAWASPLWITYRP